MTLRVEQSDSYLALHTAQVPVLGEEGQETLRRARVHISGTGRIGTWVALNLAGAGIGYVSANDPQAVEPENLGACVFARKRDLGRAKVIMLARALDGRPDFVFEPLVARIESDIVDPYIQRADLVISCANTLQGRLAADRKAIRYGKPVLQVAAFDGRESLGGLITVRLPENRSACFGCYFSDNRQFPRGEGLLSTVTATLAAIGATMAVQILTGIRSEFLKQHNLFLFDLETYQMEALAIERRKSCALCRDI
jgi:molybdopterin/thiamine biosynthesis adenylyltransferase